MRLTVYLQRCRGKLLSGRHMGYLTQWVLDQKGLQRCTERPSLALKRVRFNIYQPRCVGTFVC